MDITGIIFISIAVVIATAIIYGSKVEIAKTQAGTDTNKDSEDPFMEGMDRVLEEVGKLVDDNTWHSIDTCPTDQKVYLWHRDKDIHHIVMMDVDPKTDLATQGFTHWRAKFIDPNENS